MVDGNDVLTDREIPPEAFPGVFSPVGSVCQEQSLGERYQLFYVYLDEFLTS